MSEKKARRPRAPFAEGYGARCDGLTEYDNPYPVGDARRVAWQHGWEDADEDVCAEERANDR